MKTNNWPHVSFVTAFITRSTIYDCIQPDIALPSYSGADRSLTNKCQGPLELNLTFSKFVHLLRK